MVHIHVCLPNGNQVFKTTTYRSPPVSSPSAIELSEFFALLRINAPAKIAMLRGLPKWLKSSTLHIRGGQQVGNLITRICFVIFSNLETIRKHQSCVVEWFGHAIVLDLVRPFLLGQAATDGKEVHGKRKMSKMNIRSFELKRQSKLGWELSWFGFSS